MGSWSQIAAGIRHPRPALPLSLPGWSEFFLLSPMRWRPPTIQQLPHSHEYPHRHSVGCMSFWGRETVSILPPCPSGLWPDPGTPGGDPIISWPHFPEASDPQDPSLRTAITPSGFWVADTRESKGAPRKPARRILPFPSPSAHVPV